MPNIFRKFKILKITSILASLIFLVPESVGAKIFDEYILHFDGNLKYYLVEDLNSDGLKDVFIFFTTDKGNKSKKWFSIYYQAAQGFHEVPDQTFNPSSNMILLDIGDVIDGPGKEIVFFTHTGISYYKYQNGKYVLSEPPLIKISSIFRIPDSENIANWDFVFDLDADQVDEVIIPQFNQLVICKRDSSGVYQIYDKCLADVRSSIYTRGFAETRMPVASYSMPKCLFKDFNQDDIKDIIMLRNDKLKIFVQDQAGNFSYKPDYFIDMKFEQLVEKDEPEEINIENIEDINGDGMLDLVVHKVEARTNLLNPKTQIQLYLGKKEGLSSSKKALYNPFSAK